MYNIMNNRLNRFIYIYTLLVGHQQNALFQHQPLLPYPLSIQEKHRKTWLEEEPSQSETRNVAVVMSPRGFAKAISGGQNPGIASWPCKVLLYVYKYMLYMYIYIDF